MRGRKRHLFSMYSNVLQLCLGGGRRMAFSGYDMYIQRVISVRSICAQNIVFTG